MGSIAVIAHARKTLGGGLSQLRAELAAAGFEDPIWFEIMKSRRAPKAVRAALAEHPDVVFAWGGDGTVQRVVDAMADSGIPLAIIPTGTANLFATNLGIPTDLAEAVRIGLSGTDAVLDTGVMNGEHFAVMAGAGVDARMIEEADGSLKDAMGRASYVWTGARSLREARVKTRIRVDGVTFFRGKASCVLVANVGRIMGGITAFEDATPTDGILELGVVTADGSVQWLRTLARTAFGSADRSPFVQVARGRSMTIRFARPMLYELDGGERKPVRRLRVKAAPGSITVRVPQAASGRSLAAGESA